MLSILWYLRLNKLFPAGKIVDLAKFLGYPVFQLFAMTDHQRGGKHWKVLDSLQLMISSSTR